LVGEAKTIMTTTREAIECVEKYWDTTCPVGQKQAATVLAESCKMFLKTMNDSLSSDRLEELAEPWASPSAEVPTNE
jgi:hypothetical protein